MDIAWENAIVQMATDYPAYGPSFVHRTELRKKGISVSPAGTVYLDAA